MQTTVTTIYLFKALVILVGLAFVYMGYKLFIKGITAPAGSFTGEVGEKKLKLVRFAPGIFFALVGTVVVVVGSTRQFSITAPDGTRTESMEAKTHGPEWTDQEHWEMESAGNPPTEETDAAPTEPGTGTRAQAGHTDGGQHDGRGRAAAGLITICDTCDVR